MKRKIKIILATPLLLFSIFALIISFLYTPTYVYRLITQNVADVYDYQLYENRTIAASPSPSFQFAAQKDEEYAAYLFQDVIKRTGFSSLEEWAKHSQTTALIVVQRDTILYEKYFNGFARDSYFHSQSMAKSFISFLIGAAIDDGLITSVNDPMTKYIPELEKRDVRFGQITIKHLLEMRAGLAYNTSLIPGTYIHAPWHDEAVGYYHPDVRGLLLEEVEIAREPGSFEYCNYNTSYLGLILERTTQKTVSEYLEEKLWSQIMEYDALFSVDSKETGFEYMPSRLIARAVDYARFGRLFLHEGNWNGKQIISKDWVTKSTREDATLSRASYPEWFGNTCKRVYYGYQWWGHANCDSTFQFAASGNLGQNIYIIPTKEAVIVHCGNSLEYYNDIDLWDAAERLRE